MNKYMTKDPGFICEECGKQMPSKWERGDKVCKNCHDGDEGDEDVLQKARKKGGSSGGGGKSHGAKAPGTSSKKVCPACGGDMEREKIGMAYIDKCQDCGLELQANNGGDSSKKCSSCDSSEHYTPLTVETDGGEKRRYYVCGMCLSFEFEGVE